MFSISEAAEKSGLSSYTLRYYEKIGLLPPPKRNEGGQRFYTESDLQFIHFLKSLKQTGMSLEDMNQFVLDGCILEKIESEASEQITPSLSKRIGILSEHLEKMEQQKKELEAVIAMTQEKLSIYYSMLTKEGDTK